MRRRLFFVGVLALAVGLVGQGQEYYRTGGVTSGGGTVTGPILFGDGTSGAPSIAFSAEPTLGFWRSAAATTTHQGLLSVIGAIYTNSSIGTANGLSRVAFNAVLADDVRISSSRVSINSSNNTIGSIIKVDALPTAGTCGTSPAVTAGSTPYSGSIDVGTGTPASCILLFGGTAFPSAPHCTANVVTATAGNTRAIGTLSTTTQVTFTPATAFVASSIVAYHCISAK